MGKQVETILTEENLGEVHTQHNGFREIYFKQDAPGTVHPRIAKKTKKGNVVGGAAHCETEASSAQNNVSPRRQYAT